jgi:hypothetical protein
VNKEDRKMARKTLMSVLMLGCLALAAAGCSDDDSSPTAVRDTAPPAVPTDLTADAYLGTVAVSWAPNTTDADFAGFIVDRTCNGVTVSIVSQPQNITSIDDGNPEPGYNVYSVSAVDRNGNESAYATVGVLVQYQHSPGQIYEF